MSKRKRKKKVGVNRYQPQAAVVNNGLPTRCNLKWPTVSVSAWGDSDSVALGDSSLHGLIVNAKRHSRLIIDKIEESTRTLVAIFN
jgi:hypothetical protein